MRFGVGSTRSDHRINRKLCSVLNYSWWHIGCNVGGAWRAPIRILIAEDDPDVRSLVLDVVKDLGHTPNCARNGAEAWNLFNAMAPTSSSATG